MKYFFQESYHDPTFSQKTKEGRVVCNDSLEPALSEERISFVVTSFQTLPSLLSVSVSLTSGLMLFFSFLFTSQRVRSINRGKKYFIFSLFLTKGQLKGTGAPGS